MLRRKFVLSAIKASPFFLFQSSLTSACSLLETETPVLTDKKIIVIGAGIAGLAAAKKLKENGFTVLVLESQEKIGGRLRTDRSIGIAFDEGASWIHGPKGGNPITALAAQAGASTYLTDDESLRIYDQSGKEYNTDLLDTEYDLFEAALTAVRKAGSENQSFEAIFNSLYPEKGKERLWKYMLSAYLEFDTGGDIANLSSKYFYDDEEFSGADVIITNGYDKVAEFLGKGLDIKLNSRVTEINYGASKPFVKANGTTFEADYILVTVPLGVLKNKSIAFSPALPSEKTKAIENTQMGNVNKFLLVWKSSFWDANTQYIGYTPETKGKFNYFMNVNKFLPSSNALMTFAFGKYASQTESMSDAQITTEIMSHLKSIYGNNISNPIQFLRTKWGSNINSFGSYSFATNGSGSVNFDTLSNAVSNKLFFAGEHTERDYRGTVHGAYLSGIREADKIIDL
ncbi:MAG: FAD-dependent oxidoreductase [Bacteroidetes bacterium]|nr:FAD-dependent oxidoreductase [Bacteroidota bacterium]